MTWDLELQQGAQFLVFEPPVDSLLRSSIAYHWNLDLVYVSELPVEALLLTSFLTSTLDSLIESFFALVVFVLVGLLNSNTCRLGQLRQQEGQELLLILHL